MLFNISSTLKDLLQPGFPTINKGILLQMQTNKEKMFSNNALFLAIPFGISILFAMKFSSIIGNFKKSKNLYFSSDISLNILFNFVANLLRNSSFERRI